MKRIKLLSFIISSFFVYKVSAQSCNLQALATYTLVNNVATFSNASTGTTSATSYTWSFLYGTSIYSAPVVFTTTAVTPPPFTYTANGYYEVDLIASDSPTCTDSSGIGIHICSFTPSITITNNLGSVVTFSPHAEGPIIFQVEWFFGDGVQDLGVNNSLYTHTYFNGVYTPSLYVDYGYNFCFVTATTTPITVTNNPCYANAAFTQTIGSGGIVQFSKTAPPNNTNILWNFGDGYTSTLSNPTHTYSSAGNFHVLLDSYNPNSVPYFFNCRDTNSINLNISGIPCVANANFTMQPTGQPHAYWIDPAYPYDISSVVWSWGDGSTSTGNSVYANHTYSAAGSYDICLTVTASCGTSSSSTSYCLSQYLAKGTAGDMIAVTVRQPELIDGIAETEIENIRMELFPNPSDGDLNLSLDKEINISEIEVYDLLGKKVFLDTSPKREKFYKIYLNDLNNGIYFLYLKLPENTIKKKFIISR
jgi:PKD repeat protein